MPARTEPRRTALQGGDGPEKPCLPHREGQQTNLPYTVSRKARPPVCSMVSPPCRTKLGPVSWLSAALNGSCGSQLLWTGKGGSRGRPALEAGQNQAWRGTGPRVSTKGCGWEMPWASHPRTPLRVGGEIQGWGGGPRNPSQCFLVFRGETLPPPPDLPFATPSLLLHVADTP